MESSGNLASSTVPDKAKVSPSKGKAKSLGKGRYKAKTRPKRANGSSVATDDPDLNLDDSQLDAQPAEKFGIHKKQKELPKPAITIFMHHPWSFKNQEYLKKVWFQVSAYDYLLEMRVIFVLFREPTRKRMRNHSTDH
jgi:hypothetical protein